MMKTKELFFTELHEVYTLTTQIQTKTYAYFKAIETKTPEQEHIDSFLTTNKLEITPQARIALCYRLASLKTENFTAYLKTLKLTEKNIEKLERESYYFIQEYYQNEFEKIIEIIDEKKLLTPFYRKLLHYTHKIGKEFSKTHILWKKELLCNANKQLEKECNSDPVKIQEYLKTFKLEEYDGTTVADHSYNVLTYSKNTGFKVETLLSAFSNEITKVIQFLNQVQLYCETAQDELFHQEKTYNEYFKSLKTVFSEKDTTKVLSLWRDVDRKWMEINAPLHICHPFEYYADHYRRSVSLEWDIRIRNPLKTSTLKSDIQNMYSLLFDKISNKTHPAYEFSRKNVEKTSLFIGKPLLFYGSFFEGMFSAQVIPNDPHVSSECGKKIFAFPEYVLFSQQQKPFTKLANLVYDPAFLKAYRTFVFQQETKWFSVYDTETIGHEFGHVLWLDVDTETLMNNSGEFKNIEEFKATAGGLCCSIINNKELTNEFFYEYLTRSIGLIAWKKQGQLIPYYCEGLIHLTILFETKILDWKNSKISIDLDKSKLGLWKQKFLETYSKLAKHYLDKKDAKLFLEQYCTLKDGLYEPKLLELNTFTQEYYSLYEKFANEIDDSDKKENYLI